MDMSGNRDRDRRRSARHVVQNVNGTLHFSADARIINMSLTGMAVETDAQLRVGRTYSLSLRHGSDQALRLSGTVVWCHLRSLRRTGSTETRPVYEAGIHFDQALTGTASDVARILQASAVVAVEQRISGRFTVDVPEPVAVNGVHPFEVKTISAVGVLVETDATTPVDAVIEVELHLGGSRLAARGRVAYVNDVTGNGGKSHQLGIEFIELPAGDRAVIEEFIGRSIAEGTAASA